MVKNKKQNQPDVADRLTEAIGTQRSLVVHTFVFAGIFLLYFFGVSIDHILLLLTTCLSIEAIYLAIFIQITVNKTTQSLEQVEDDIDDIQEDVQEDDLHDRELSKTLKNIEKQLNSVQKDLAVLKDKGLL